MSHTDGKLGSWREYGPALVGDGAGTPRLPQVYEVFIGTGQSERLRVLGGESAWGIEAAQGVRVTGTHASVRGKNPVTNREQRTGGFCNLTGQELPHPG